MTLQDNLEAPHLDITDLFPLVVSFSGSIYSRMVLCCDFCPPVAWFVPKATLLGDFGIMGQDSVNKFGRSILEPCPIRQAETT